MTEVVFIFTEVILALLFFRLMKKGGFKPFPDGAVLYLMHMELVLYLEVAGYISYDFLDSYSSFSFIDNFNIISLLIAAYGAVLFFVKKKQRFNVDFAELARNIKISRQAIFILLGGVYTLKVLWLIHIRWDLIWLNDTYMMMSGPGVMDEGTPWTSMLSQLQTPLAVMSSPIFFLLYFRKDPSRWFFLPVFLFNLAYLLGSHSRMPALIFFCGASIALIYEHRKTAVLFLFLVVVAFVQALVGRGEGAHGLSQIANIPHLFWLGVTVSGGSLLANSAEGVFVAAETLVFRPDFAINYKLLSFSPLLSFMDGFVAVRLDNAIPVGPFSPMSAVNEVTAFGLPYFLVFFGFQFWAGRLTSQAIDSKPGMLSYALNISVLLGFLTEFAYPTRSVFRFFVYPLIVYVFF